MTDHRRLADLFGHARPLIGMVHLSPLPGAPRFQGAMDPVIEGAVRDAEALHRAGFDGVMVENYQDAPFYPARVPPETVAALAVVAREVVRAVDVPVGVNMLRNDGVSAMAVAVACGARFVRVNVHTGAMLGDQGWLLGEAHATMRLRAALKADIALVADVLVKHATPPPGLDIGQAARDAAGRGMADGLIVSGLATGARTDPDRLDAVRAATPATPVWIGSGLTAENAKELLPHCDGAIVGSALMHGGRAGAGVDSDRAAAFLAAARQVSDLA